MSRKTEVSKIPSLLIFWGFYFIFKLKKPLPHCTLQLFFLEADEGFAFDFNSTLGSDVVSKEVNNNTQMTNVYWDFLCSYEQKGQ